MIVAPYIDGATLTLSVAVSPAVSNTLEANESVLGTFCLPAKAESEVLTRLEALCGGGQDTFENILIPDRTFHNFIIITIIVLSKHDAVSLKERFRIPISTGWIRSAMTAVRS